jgi:hypothetical protein
MHLVNYPTDYDAIFFINKVIQEEGLYVCNMHNIVEKHFTISIAPVRSRGGSTVFNNKDLFLYPSKYFYIYVRTTA